MKDSPNDEGQDPRTVQLLSRLEAGDTSALGQLLAREGPRIMRGVRPRIPADLRPRFGASDILQLAAADLLAMHEQFQNRGAAAFRALMARIVRQTLASAIARERAQKRDPAKELRSVASGAGASKQHSPLDGVPARQATPSEVLCSQEDVLALQRRFGELGTADQVIIRLIDYQGLDHVAAAQVLGIDHTAARKRHSRAVARLRALMEPEQ